MNTPRELRISSPTYTIPPSVNCRGHLTAETRQAIDTFEASWEDHRSSTRRTGGVCPKPNTNRIALLPVKLQDSILRLLPPATIVQMEIEHSSCFSSSATNRIWRHLYPSAVEDNFDPFGTDICRSFLKTVISKEYRGFLLKMLWYGKKWAFDTVLRFRAEYAYTQWCASDRTEDKYYTYCDKISDPQQAIAILCNWGSHRSALLLSEIFEKNIYRDDMLMRFAIFNAPQWQSVCQVCAWPLITNRTFVEDVLTQRPEALEYLGEVNRRDEKLREKFGLEKYKRYSWGGDESYLGRGNGTLPNGYSDFPDLFADYRRCDMPPTDVYKGMLAGSIV